MSFLKQLLTPFVEFEEDKKEPTVLTKQPQAAAPGKTITPPPADVNVQHPLVNDHNIVDDQTPSYSPGGTIAKPLPEHQQYFEKLINDANLNSPIFQGTDFKEFVDSKVDIDDITDESLKYKTAFNVLKSTGLTIDRLKSTGQAYLDLVGRDLNAFQSAHAQQYKKEVGGKEVLIQKKAEELQQLAQKINTLKGEINQLTSDVNIIKEKLNVTKNSFLLAGEIKQTEIQKELDKISQFF